MSLRGVSIGPYDIFQNTLTEQDFINLKSLGISYVKILCAAGHLVDENWEWKTSYKSGERVIDTWLRYINFASDAGLKVTPDIVLYGEGVSSWLNDVTFWDPNVYPRFAELWGVLAELFDNIDRVISLHILHVPGHGGTGSEEDWMNIVTPSCIESIRAKSNKRISWIPWRMGWSDVEGYPCHTGYYAVAKPLPYSNIEYCFNHYANLVVTGLTDRVTHYCDPYDGNIEPLLWHLQPAINFKEKYNVPMMCAEFGIKIIDCGGWPLVEPSRLDWVRNILTLFKQYDFDWAYWNMAIPEAFGGDSWSIMTYDHTFRTELVELLAFYSTPLSPIGNILETILRFLGPIGVGLYLIGRRVTRRG